MTIETLAEIKNPRPYIQHNKAINQQVNNGMAKDMGDTHAYAQENQKSSNELLSHQPSQHMDNIALQENKAYEAVDRRRTLETVTGNQKMESVGA